MSKRSQHQIVKSFSRKVIHKRYVLGLPQEAVALMADCNKKVIQQLESGKNAYVTLVSAYKIAKALNLSLDDLFVEDLK